MGKFIFLVISLCVCLFATTPLDEAISSFGLGGGANENGVLYKMAQERESGVNQKAFFKKTILLNKKNYLVAKKVLEEKGVPTSFLWIAMTESKFDNSTALSRTKTAGIWQMVPYTSKMFGLKIAKGVDERKDVEKCTAAFADYCNYMYKKFKDWGAVAVAYNCGDDRLKKIMHRAGTNDINALLDPDKKILGKETRVYFKRVITLARTANHDDIKEFLAKLESGEEG